MDFTNIPITKDTAISIVVSIPNQPQNFVAKLFQYDLNKVLEKELGVMHFRSTELLIGMPSTLKQKFFAVSGLVIPTSNNPSFYQVVVEIVQDGLTIFKETPIHGGSGTLSEKDISFIYGFILNIP